MPLLGEARAAVRWLLHWANVMRKLWSFCLPVSCLLSQRPGDRHWWIRSAAGRLLRNNWVQAIVWHGLKMGRCSVRKFSGYCRHVGKVEPRGEEGLWYEFNSGSILFHLLAQSFSDAIRGFDKRDPTSVSQSTRARIAAQLRERPKQKALRIGVPVEYNIEELSPFVREGWFRALDKLQKQGHTIHRVSLPATRHALSAYYVLAPAEASSNLAKYDGVRYGFRKSVEGGAGGVLYANTRGEGFGDEVMRRILLGAYSLSAEAIDNYFVQAQKVRRLVQRDFNRVFALPNPLLDTTKVYKGGKGMDVLISPTAPTLPPTLEALEKQSALDAYMNDVFTVPASLAGLPAISVPVMIHFEKPMPELGYQHEDKAWSHPVGVQVIAQYGDDDLVFDVAKMLEH